MMTFFALNFQSFQNNYFSVHIHKYGLSAGTKQGSRLTFFATHRVCYLLLFFDI